MLVVGLARIYVFGVERIAHARAVVQNRNFRKIHDEFESHTNARTAERERQVVARFARFSVRMQHVYENGLCITYNRRTSDDDVDEADQKHNTSRT